MEEADKQRLADLQAAAPVKAAKEPPFAIVDLAKAAKAFADMGCPKAMVYVWLVHETRKTGKRAVPVPNKELAKYGVARETKRRALNEMHGKMILLEQQPRKTPKATLL